MAITQTVCVSFLKECLTATHDLTPSTGDTFKIALYTSSASLGASTTAYSATNEISGTGYVAGGTTITSVAPTTSGLTAICDFSDPSWPTATLSGVRAALIYNSSKGNKAVAVLDFGTDRSVTAQTFTVTMPVPDADRAIVRLVSQS